MDKDEAIVSAVEYAARNGLNLVQRAGAGIHGIVYFVAGKTGLGTAAIKCLFNEEAERRYNTAVPDFANGCGDGDSWLRVPQLIGFEVPLLLDADDVLRALKLSFVMPPFVLDFAGAYLDAAPGFSEEVWAEWERNNRERLGDDWPMAQAILAHLRSLGIQMHDPSPTNIRFR